MTADEARERVGEARRSLDRAMRALSVPETRWEDAALEMADVYDACRYLMRALMVEHFNEKRRRWNGN